jgi:prefoldin subunit 5
VREHVVNVPAGQRLTGPVLVADLQASLRELHDVSDTTDALHRELAIEQDQVRSLDSRITSLQEDVRRSQDAETLQQMGAPLTAVTPPDCPTCHQELPSTLLDPASAIVAMPIERNIQLLKEQIDLFRAMRSDLNSAIAAKRQQIVGLDERVHVLQQTVRAQRETLVSASGTPSITDVERRLHLRDRVEALTNVQGRLASLNLALARWLEPGPACLQSRHNSAYRAPRTGTRRNSMPCKRASWISFATTVFASLPISELTISEDTYQPVYEGFDLGFDLSASDMVRTIWSQRLGLLEVARQFASRHAKLLVFDEPRQQSTDPLSFTALFERAGQAAEYGQQVIFATSEPELSVRAMLGGVGHQYLRFEGKMIRRLEQ